MIDVIQFYQEDVPLDQIIKTGIRSYAGPCPSCGGQDRFHCEGVLWGCRQCDARKEEISGGSTVDYLIKYRRMSVKAACQLAGKEKSASQVSWVNQRKEPVAREPKEPCERWSRQAAKLLTETQKNLFLPASQAILKARHISTETALAAGIGYIPKDRYLKRAEWGLEPVNGYTKIKVPAGLLMAVRRKAGIKALQVRCYPVQIKDGKETKHWRVAGSGQGFSFILGTGTEGACLFESILDAVLAHEVSGGTLTTVATLSAPADIDPQTAIFLQGCKYLFGCPDRDEAGLGAWQRWQAAFPGIRLAQPGYSKDLGELADREGMETLRRWYEELILAPIRETGGRAEPIEVPPGNPQSGPASVSQQSGMTTDVQAEPVGLQEKEPTSGPSTSDLQADTLCRDCGLWTPLRWGLRGACTAKRAETSAVARCAQIVGNALKTE